MNYLNTQGPRNGNYFNAPEDDDDDLLPGGAGNFFSSPFPVTRDRVDYTLYSSGDGGGSDDAMPVFRPGEVREAPTPVGAAQPARQENAAAAPEPVQKSQASQPVAAAGEGDEAAEIDRENQLEELHPFTSVPGGPANPLPENNDRQDQPGDRGYRPGPVSGIDGAHGQERPADHQNAGRRHADGTAAGDGVGRWTGL
ncbi:MAG: hypothetical protein ACYCZX_04450 [Rhodospirillaceae bacterium]